MSQKTYIPSGEMPPSSQIGATFEALAATIAARREAGEESYTYRLLTGSPDGVLKKVMEEAGETALAAEGRGVVGVLVAGGIDRGKRRCRRDRRAGRRSAAEYDAAIDHLRYEAADVVYHLLVVLERYGIGLDEFAAELNNRMTDAERPEGGVRLHEDHVKRGK